MVIAKGGNKLLRNFGDFLPPALVASYPEHHWQTWRFPRVSKKFFKDEDQVRSLVKWLSEEFRVEDLNDWYRVSATQVQKLVTTNGISKQGGLAKLLAKVYPYHDWDLKKFTVPKASQRMLKLKLQDLFPNSGW